MTNAEFKSIYDDFYVVKSAKAYNNNQDGNISSGTPRTLLGNVLTGNDRFDYCQNIYFSAIQNNTTTYNGDGDILFPIFNALFSNETNDAAVYGIRDYIPEIHNFAMYAESTKGNRYLSGTPLQLLCIIKKNDLVKMLNNIGVPFSFNENEVKYNNSSTFSDYVAKGQPENSTGVS